MVELYNNTVQLNFDARTHKYTVREGGATFNCPSVTSVLRIIDKSGPLVGWAVNCTLDVCKQAIQSNTQYSEVYLEQVWEQAKRSNREVKQQAANIGTQAHKWIEHHLKGEDREVTSEILPCVNAALDWLGGHNCRVVSTERPVYSKNHRVAGTLDLLAEIEGRLSVVDFKTSNALYPEYNLQLAAYAGMYYEEYGEKVERWLVRLGKDGEFEARKLTGMRKDWGAFLAACRLHKRMGELR